MFSLSCLIGRSESSVFETLDSLNPVREGRCNPRAARPGNAAVLLPIFSRSFREVKVAAINVGQRLGPLGLNFFAGPASSRGGEIVPASDVARRPWGRSSLPRTERIDTPAITNLPWKGTGMH